MLVKMATKNQQWFGGRWFDVEEVLYTLSCEYGIERTDGWIERTLSKTYEAQCGARSTREVCAKKRIQDDYAEYLQEGKLPYYCMRTRLDCVSAVLVENESG